jgi:hypothetical protein
VDRVVGLAAEQSLAHEREHDLAEVLALPDPHSEKTVQASSP